MPTSISVSEEASLVVSFHFGTNFLQRLRKTQDTFETPSILPDQPLQEPSLRPLSLFPTI
jgi:hypothetical protein